MASSEPVQYHHVFHSNPFEFKPNFQTRLAKLLPGALYDPIACDLIRVRFDENPKYEALSYTWGDEAAPISIQFSAEGRSRSEFSVTRNLGMALRHLRKEFEPRILWIDALCINQKNDKEKKQQVALMPEIYGRADRVLVWLGPAADESDKIMDELGRERSRGPWELEKCGKQLMDEDKNRLRRALEALLERDYWTRAWVVQEIVKAQKINLHCGLKSASWKHATRIMEAFVKERNRRIHGNLGGDQPLLQVSERTLVMKPQTLGVLRHLSFYRLCPQDKRGPLWLRQMLVRLRHFKCKDPRDKIFSLLGLVNTASLQTDRSRRPTIYVDYSLSHREVSTHLFEWCVRTELKGESSRHGHEGRLDILCASQPDRQLDQSDRFPSWLPDFSKDNGMEPWPTFSYQSQARFPADKPTFSEDYSVLFIQARRRTVLREGCVTSRFDDCQASNVIGLLTRIWTFMRLARANEWKPSIEDDLFWNTLVLGEEASKTLLTWLRNLRPKAKLDDRQSLWETFRDGIENSIEPAVVFFGAFRRTSFRRRLAYFTTEGQVYPAMVPADARPGDVLYLPGDCDYPVLLRRRDSQWTDFEFVGPCCIPRWGLVKCMDEKDEEVTAVSLH